MSGSDEGSRREAALEEGACALGVALAPAARRRLLAYVELIGRWNRVYNLTAVRDPDEMLVQHVLDSLAVVGPLRRQVGEGATVLDVGSGAGLPGVVLAIASPELRISCVDAVDKKASFVRQVAAELGLDNLESMHARVESLVPRRWDLITSRAFASLCRFCDLTRPLLADGGRWMAMKGQRPIEEIDALPPEIRVFHVEPLQVPRLGAERCLVWMRPGSAADT
jgi:16S rRNA (guanine527-N7)-methyltransferase